MPLEKFWQFKSCFRFCDPQLSAAVEEVGEEAALSSTCLLGPWMDVLWEIETKTTMVQT